MSERPEIALVLVGGTISTVATSSLDLSAYHETGIREQAASLLRQVPEVEEFATIEPVDFRHVSSSELTEGDWISLLSLVETLVAQKVGVVIAHGTNTLEETAYFLDLCLRTDRPVVLVGAMRPLAALSSDVALNLVRAIQVASSGDAVGMGVLVSMGQRIFTARDVTKTSTHSIEAFQAPDSGPIGSVELDGRVVIDRARIRRSPHFSLRVGEKLPRVDIVVSHVGADGTFIDAAVAAGARGIISAGTGAGRTTQLEGEALARAAKANVIVCLSTRVGSGSVAPTPITTALGVVSGRGLVPWKARVLLALALTRTENVSEIQKLFDES